MSLTQGLVHFCGKRGTAGLALFSGPAQLSVAYSTEKWERPWNNLSREWRKGREKGREDLIKLRRIIDLPTHIVDQ